jgi:hypothetical protein
MKGQVDRRLLISRAAAADRLATFLLRQGDGEAVVDTDTGLAADAQSAKQERDGWIYCRCDTDETNEAMKKGGGDVKSAPQGDVCPTRTTGSIRA